MNHYQLKSCVWEITLSCCFSCRYCGSGGGKRRENELTTSECLNVALQLSDLGCRRVSLIGGEVFMRQDWPEIVQALTSKGIATCIITNGFILTKEHIRQLKKSDIESVAVSLDGPEAIHDRYRQQSSYRCAMETIHTLVRSHVPVSVISTLNSENILFLDEMYQALDRLGIFAWQLQACSPMGNAAKNGVDVAFDFKKVIDFVDANAPQAPFILGIADNIGYYTAAEGRIRGNLSGKAGFSGCCAGLTSIGIDSVGNVRGCESMYDAFFIEGNLRERNLREIWEDPDSFAYNRRFKQENLTGKCKNCEMGAYCAGGCRSYNYFTHNKLYDSLRCAK